MEEKSVKDILLAHREHEEIASRPAIKFEDQEWSYLEYVNTSIAWANALLSQHDKKSAFNVGVLLDNGPSYCFSLGAVAFLGGGLVGINPTRRGGELVRDISHTDCEIVLTESRHRDLLSEVESASDLDIKVFSVDEEEWMDLVKAELASDALPEPPEREVDIKTPYLLLFTSGTTGDPKAAICSQARLTKIGALMCENHELTKDDVFYQAMPMFHSNALMAGWAPCVVAGGTGAFRRRFSASNWLGDVQKFGATYFNYVGKPLTYILAAPETAEDKNHKLRRVFGNEGAVHDLKRFEERFGIPAFDSYGSTEGGIGITRTEETPPAALGKGDEFTKILNPNTEEECPLAEFDETGKLLNPEEAIGELVHLKSQAMFEGYWNNPEADNERTHGNKYWSGDLGYKDAEVHVYIYVTQETTN